MILRYTGYEPTRPGMLSRKQVSDLIEIRKNTWGFSTGGVPLGGEEPANPTDRLGGEENDHG